MARIEARQQDVAGDARLAESVSIRSDHVFIGPRVVIDEDVTIDARTLHIGTGTVIEKRCELGGLRAAAERIQIGDFSFVGHDAKVMVPELVVGDYTAIHNHVLVSGHRLCHVGHNSFVGQHSVLNAGEELRIGNNFRMSLNGYVWTHAESGELLEGCNFYHRTPTVIEDNVWLAGSNVSISPGVRLRDGTIVLMGSVVTSDTEPRHCYGGVPARDLTERMHPYREVSFAEKVEMMRRFVGEFLEAHDAWGPSDVCFVPKPGSAADPDARVVVQETGAPAARGAGVSVFSIAEKTYLKQRTTIEEQLMRFLVGARARFLPVE